MRETRKISLSFPYSVREKNVAEMLLKVRIKIKEIKKSQPELRDFALANIGMYREGDEIQVNLYFTKGDKTQLISEEKRADI